MAASKVGLWSLMLSVTRLSLENFRLSGEAIIDADAIQNEAWLLLFLLESFIYFELLH